MNFLQLCQAVQQEAGIPGDPMGTTAGQKGELKRVVTWTRRAWDEIQAEKRDWTFLWKEFSVVFSPGNNTYAVALSSSPGGVGTAWPRPLVFRMSKYGITGAPIFKLGVYEPNVFQELFGHLTPMPGPPFAMTFLPDLRVRFNTVLDVFYNFSGEYQRAPQQLVSDLDVPLLPLQYHNAIMYRALRMYAEYEEASSLVPSATKNDNHWSDMLIHDCLPRAIVGQDPLVVYSYSGTH